MYRVGFGKDIHRLILSRELFLGGVKIDSTVGADAHSDGDVLIHALIDALLGAASLGDIGTLFPDTDQKYRGIASEKLLLSVIELIKSKHYQIINIDTSITLERPKIANDIFKIRQNLSRIIDIGIERISIKAMTNEGLDALGRSEAVEATAVCLLKIDE